jgi:hypothetical protein
LPFKFKIVTSNPLNTDKMITRAALPIKTPAIEIPEMMLMACIFFRENRYRLAMYTEVFK